jgi:ferrochelatase
MSRYLGTTTFDHASRRGIGVLLVNLGTPQAPTAAAVRRFLAEFLADPRVVELPRPLWWLILHGYILRVRPGRVAHAYQQIWTPDGSPLAVISAAQARALQAALAALYGDAIRVEFAMRYGAPAIDAALARLAAARCEHLLVLPLYPQYSGSATGSVFDAVTEALRRHRRVPELRFVAQYHDHPGYVAALAQTIRAHWVTHGHGDRLLFSFHGVPHRSLLAGDPYHCQCHKTARLVAEALGLEPSQWQVSFQSRFGRARWLQPYTDVTLVQWAAAGIKRADLVCPGFAADCLETLEELRIRARASFLEAGGERLELIPCLNDTPQHIAALRDIVIGNVNGWPGTEALLDPDASNETRRLTATRARALGADR